jgi:hypothetical protein
MSVRQVTTVLAVCGIRDDLPAAHVGVGRDIFFSVLSGRALAKLHKVRPPVIGSKSFFDNDSVQFHSATRYSK